MTGYEDFLKLDVRVGVITAASEFPQARKAAYKLTIDFGEVIGIKQSSAQITKNYQLAELVGTQVLGVVNLPPKQIGPFISECLTLGVPDDDGEVILIKPERTATLGGRMF